MYTPKRLGVYIFSPKQNIFTKIILRRFSIMKYSKEQRLLIGREIYTHQISLNHAAEKYGINRYTARDYMREYRDTNNLEPMEVV